MTINDLHPPSFRRTGSKEFWELSKDLGSDDEEEGYDPNAFNGKKGPRINVKKNSGW